MGKRPTIQEEAAWATCEDRMVSILWVLPPVAAAAIAVHIVIAVMVIHDQELAAMRASGSQKLVFKFADSEKDWIRDQGARLPPKAASWDSAAADSAESQLNVFPRDEQTHIALSVARWAVCRWERAKLTSRSA